MSDAKQRPLVPMICADKPIEALRASLLELDTYAVYCRCGRQFVVEDVSIGIDGTVHIHTDRCPCQPEVTP